MLLISVIMNGFNSARYLSEAIESLREQDYNNWELIFWDNCSEDESEKIVRSFGDPRIKFYRAPYKMNLAKGRDMAIAQSSGEWLAFLDCDDLWMPDKLSQQLNRLAEDKEGNAGLIYTRTLSFSSRGEEGETTYQYQGRSLPEGNILQQLLLEGNLIPIVSALVSRKAYEHTGGIPDHLTFAEDYWMFVAIAAQFRVLCVQEPCCRYRVHEQSATYCNKLASHKESLEVLECWGKAISPEKLQKRSAVYHTLIGIEIIRTRKNIIAGISEILFQGSLPFLFRGMFSYGLRRIIKRRRSYS